MNLKLIKQVFSIFQTDGCFTWGDWLSMVITFEGITRLDVEMIVNILTSDNSLSRLSRLLGEFFISKEKKTDFAKLKTYLEQDYLFMNNFNRASIDRNLRKDVEKIEKVLKAMNFSLHIVAGLKSQKIKISKNIRTKLLFLVARLSNDCNTETDKSVMSTIAESYVNHICDREFETEENFYDGEFRIVSGLIESFEKPVNRVVAADSRIVASSLAQVSRNRNNIRETASSVAASPRVSSSRTTSIRPETTNSQQLLSQQTVTRITVERRATPHRAQHVAMPPRVQHVVPKIAIKLSEIREVIRNFTVSDDKHIAYSGNRVRGENLVRVIGVLESTLIKNGVFDGNAAARIYYELGTYGGNPSASMRDFVVSENIQLVNDLRS